MRIFKFGIQHGIQKVAPSLSALIRKGFENKRIDRYGQFLPKRCIKLDAGMRLNQRFHSSSLLFEGVEHS